MTTLLPTRLWVLLGQSAMPREDSLPHADAVSPVTPATVVFVSFRSCASVVGEA